VPRGSVEICAGESDSGGIRVKQQYKSGCERGGIAGFVRHTHTTWSIGIIPVMAPHKLCFGGPSSRVVPAGLEPSTGVVGFPGLGHVDIESIKTIETD
jgi:hypothetical protein